MPLEFIQIGGSGASYEVLHMTSSTRAIIKYDGGIPVAVDRAADGQWDLSGEPARGEELEIVRKNSPAMDTT